MYIQCLVDPPAFCCGSAMPQAAGSLNVESPAGSPLHTPKVGSCGWEWVLGAPRSQHISAAGEQVSGSLNGDVRSLSSGEIAMETEWTLQLWIGKLSILLGHGFHSKLWNYGRVDHWQPGYGHWKSPWSFFLKAPKVCWTLRGSVPWSSFHLWV